MLSGQAPVAFVGKPTDLYLFCLVLTGQWHQRRCDVRTSRRRPASSGNLHALQLVVVVNRVQLLVLVELVVASRVVVRASPNKDDDNVLSRRVRRHGGAGPSTVLAEFSR